MSGPTPAQAAGPLIPTWGSSRPALWVVAALKLPLPPLSCLAVARWWRGQPAGQPLGLGGTPQPLLAHQPTSGCCLRHPWAAGCGQRGRSGWWGWGQHGPPRLAQWLPLLPGFGGCPCKTKGQAQESGVMAGAWWFVRPPQSPY